jgi:hypothetical protein
MDLATQMIVLLIYFLGVGLCLWRPTTWRNRVALSVIAAGLWAGLFVFVPSLRVWPFVSGAVTFFVLSWLFRPRPQHAP